LSIVPASQGWAPPVGLRAAVLPLTIRIGGMIARIQSQMAA